MPTHGNVLIVDDDHNAGELIRLLLADTGYDATTTACAEEALRYLYSESVCDVVIADIRLPDMRGTELKQRIEETRPGLPVVLISGESDGIDAALSTGDLALAKPFSGRRLVAVVEDAMATGKGRSG